MGRCLNLRDSPGNCPEFPRWRRLRSTFTAHRRMPVFKKPRKGNAPVRRNRLSRRAPDPGQINSSPIAESRKDRCGSSICKWSRRGSNPRVPNGPRDFKPRQQTSPNGAQTTGTPILLALRWAWRACGDAWAPAVRMEHGRSRGRLTGSLSRQNRSIQELASSGSMEKRTPVRLKLPDSLSIVDCASSRLAKTAAFARSARE